MLSRNCTFSLLSLEGIILPPGDKYLQSVSYNIVLFCLEPYNIINRKSIWIFVLGAAAKKLFLKSRNFHYNTARITILQKITKGVLSVSAKSIMIQGTGSNVGESVIAVALCRILSSGENFRVRPNTVRHGI